MKLPLALNKDAVKSRRHPPRHKASSVLQAKYILLIVFGAVWWSISPLLANPVLPHPLPQPFTHPTYPLQILSAVQSVTGLITVAEWLPLPSQIENDQEMHSVRYLRASHSLLGGVWTRSKVQTLDGALPVSDSFGTPLGDSIYSTFVLQEAARLVNSTEVGKSGKWSNVLIMWVYANLLCYMFQQAIVASAQVSRRHLSFGMISQRLLLKLIQLSIPLHVHTSACQIPDLKTFF